MIVLKAHHHTEMDGNLHEDELQCNFIITYLLNKTHHQCTNLGILKEPLRSADGVHDNSLQTRAASINIFSDVIFKAE